MQVSDGGSKVSPPAETSRDVQQQSNDQEIAVSDQKRTVFKNASNHRTNEVGRKSIC
jgi:hypothetical protein